MANWSFQFTDRHFATQGEIVNLKSGKVGVALNKVRTGSLSVRLDNPLAHFIANNSQFEPIYMKAYRNNQLLFFGPVATVQESGDESRNGALQVTATSPEVIWGFNFSYGAARPNKIPAGVPRAVRFMEKASLYNGSSNNSADHIDFTLRTITSSNTEEYEETSFKTLMEVLIEMSNSAAGFDWTVYPIEATGTSLAGNIGTFEAKDVIGTDAPNAVFEWGGGRNNVATFNRTIDMTQIANLVYNVGAGGPEAPGSPTVASEWGAGTVAAGYGDIWSLRQALMPLSVLNNQMRQKYVDEAALVRRVPRQTVQFQPIVDAGTGRVPTFGSDYQLGDRVRARIIYQKSVHWDVSARVWGVDFAVDENNRETQTLSLSEN